MLKHLVPRLFTPRTISTIFLGSICGIALIFIRRKHFEWVVQYTNKGRSFDHAIQFLTANPQISLFTWTIFDFIIQVNSAQLLF